MISVCIQAFTTGWLTVNSISQDFRQNFGTVPTVSKLITQFESNISLGERVSPVNYRGMLHNLSKVIDVPVPLAAAEKQRYFLASGQSNLQLTENQLRAVINQYTTIDLIWLQVFNRKFAHLILSTIVTWLRNHRYNRVNGTVRIVGVCFQGSNRVLSSFEYFGPVWTGTTKEILIKEAIPQLKLYQPDNKVHLEGLLLPINGSRLATYLNQPPPELDNSSIPDILGTSSKMAKISPGKDGGSSLIEDKATESPPTAKDGDDFMDKKAR